MNTENPVVVFRVATQADALCLGVLATQVFLDTYAFTGITEEIANKVKHDFSAEVFAELLANSSTFITVAVHETALVGFAQTTLGTEQALAPGGKPAELDRLYIQEPFTKHGIGSTLLASHETQAARNGAAVLWLSTWVGNKRARHFYPKHGYQDYGLVSFNMGQYKIENRVFAKILRIAA